MLITKAPITSIPKNINTGVPEHADVNALYGTLSDHYTKAPISQSSVVGQQLGGAIGGTMASIVAGVGAYMIKDKWASLKGKSGKVNMSNLVTNISTVMYDLMRFYFGSNLPTKPAAVLASIPLGTVTEVSNAMSRRDLKFRAVGGVFLADQEGGEESLRIVGKAWGPNRFIFLSLLDFLFMYGSAKTVDLFADFLKDPLKIGVPTPYFGVGNLPQSTNPWHTFEAFALDEGTADARLTFPVITRQKVYMNMFIETYEYTESIENGINVVEYVIFLRKLKIPPPFEFMEVMEAKGSGWSPQWYYKDNINDAAYRRFNIINVFTGLGFSSAMIMYRFVSILVSGTFGFRETLISRFGIALNRSVSGNVDSEMHYSDEWSVGEKENLFGYPPCEGLSGLAKKQCLQIDGV